MRSEHESSRSDSRSDSSSRSPSSGRDEHSEASHESDHEHISSTSNNRLTTGALLKAVERTEKAEAEQSQMNETRDESNTLPSFSANSLLQLKETKVPEHDTLKEEPSMNSATRHDEDNLESNSMLSSRSYRRSRSREREKTTRNGLEQETTQTSGEKEEPEYRVMFHGREVLATDLIGLRVAKTFAGHGRFLGQIVRFNIPSTTYTVVYADGDTEELDVLSTIDILIQDEIERAEPFPPSKTSILLPREENDEESQRERERQKEHPQKLIGAPESPTLSKRRPSSPIILSEYDVKLIAKYFDSHALPLLVRQGWCVQGAISDRFGRRFITPDDRGGMIFDSPAQVIEYISSDVDLLHACFPRDIHEIILAFSQHPQSLAERRSPPQHIQVPYRKRPHMPEEDIEVKRRKEFNERQENSLGAPYMPAYRQRQNEEIQHPHGYRGDIPSSHRPPSPQRGIKDAPYVRMGGAHLRHGERVMYEAEAHRYTRDRSQDRGTPIRPLSAGSSVIYRERGLPSRSSGAEPFPRWGHSATEGQLESREYPRQGPTSERIEHPHAPKRYSMVDSPDWRDRYRQTANVGPISEHSYASGGYADRFVPGHSRSSFRGPGVETPPYRGLHHPEVEDSPGRDSPIGNGPNDPYRRLPSAGGRPMYKGGIDAHPRHEIDAPPGGHFRSNGLPERLPNRSSFSGHPNSGVIPSRPGGAISMMDLERDSQHRTPSMDHRMYPEELYGHRPPSANRGRELPRFQGGSGSGRPIMEMPAGRGP